MPIRLTGDRAADTLLTDDAFALVVAMVLDQQIPLERAFTAPLLLRERLGGALDVHEVAAMDPDELAAVFSARPALHRFPVSMAARVQRVAQVVVADYDGDAANLWRTAPDGATLLARLRALPGFGEQKARIFVGLLGKQLGVTPPGWPEAAGAFGRPGTFVSVADIDSPEALERVRAYKQAVKTAAKSSRQ
jgi:uncharacterized HhH-GPD family protein